MNACACVRHGGGRVLLLVEGSEKVVHHRVKELLMAASREVAWERRGRGGRRGRIQRKDC